MSGKDRGDGIFQLRGHMAHGCQCSLPADSMPQFILFPRSLSVSLGLSLCPPTHPQAVGCVIIDLGGGNSLERVLLSSAHTIPHTHTHMLCTIIQSCLVSAGVALLRACKSSADVVFPSCPELCAELPILMFMRR